MKKTKIMVSVAMVLLVIFVVWYAQRPQETKTITMSNLGATCDLVNLIAYEQGYYLEEGLEVELTKFDTSNQVSDALIAGRIDVSGCFSYPVAFAVEANQPDTFKSIRSLITSSEHPFLWIVAPADDQTINSVKDLGGKKVGLFPGSTTQAQLTHALKVAEVDPATVTMQAIAPAQQINALLAGSVDALFTLEPTPTIAAAQGVGRKVENLEKYLIEPNYNALYAVTKNYYANHKDIVTSVIKAQDKAVDYLRNNPAEARKILTRYTPLDEGLSMQVGVGYPLRSNEQTDLVKVQEYADLLFEEGDLKAKIDTGRLFSD